MYIQPDARESYRHWWESQTYWLYAIMRWDPYKSVADEIGYLYPHLRQRRRKRRRNHGSSVRRWIKPWDISTSGESRFRQGGYEPKPENPKEAWREHKQISRDKAKREGRRRYSNAGWYGKRIVHRSRRQHERECIAAGRYDEISQGVQDIVRCWWD